VNAAALEGLYREHRAYALKMALGFLGAVPDRVGAAEDVVQDVFLRLLRLDVVLKENPRSFIGIAVKYAVMTRWEKDKAECRDRARTRSLEEVSGVGWDAPAPTVRVEDSVVVRVDLGAAIAALPPRCREGLLRVAFSPGPHGNTTHWQAHDARKRLRVRKRSEG
jgi:DNA-directed RNA polymerase specialized sigma24 family protein